MSNPGDIDPNLLLERRVQEVEALYTEQRFAYMESFYGANPDLAKIRDNALDNIEDLSENPLNSDGVVYEDSPYRWAETNLAWVNAQEQRAFVASQRDEIDESNQDGLNELVDELDTEILLREYMRNIYADPTKAQETTRLYDFPTTEGLGNDWVGSGHKLIEAKVKRAIFDARYVQSAYQDYGYAPNEGFDPYDEYSKTRETRNILGPTLKRLFFYQPFTRDPRDIIQELHEHRDGLSPSQLDFFDMRAAQMLLEDEKTDDETRQEAEEQLVKSVQLWDDQPLEDQAKVVRDSEVYSNAVQPLYRQVIAGFSPVINHAIQKVKDAYPSTCGPQEVQKLQEDALLSAVFMLSRANVVMAEHGDDINDLKAMMGWLFSSVVFGFDKIVLTSGKTVKSKALNGVYEGSDGLSQAVFDEGFFDLDEFVPDSLKRFSIRSIIGYEPQTEKPRALKKGSILKPGAKISIPDSRTLKKPRFPGINPIGEPLPGLDEAIAKIQQGKKPGLRLPGLPEPPSSE